MIGLFVLALAITFTILVLWKRLMLFVLAAVGFWAALLDYVLSNIAEGTIQKQLILAFAAVVGGLFLYGMAKMNNWVSTDDISHPLRRFFNKLNGESTYTSNSHDETVEEYRARVHRALHPNRIKRPL